MFYGAVVVVAGFADDVEFSPASRRPPPKILSANSLDGTNHPGHCGVGNAGFDSGFPLCRRTWRDRLHRLRVHSSDSASPPHGKALSGVLFRISKTGPFCSTGGLQCSSPKAATLQIVHSARIKHGTGPRYGTCRTRRARPSVRVVGKCRKTFGRAIKPNVGQRKAKQ